MKERYVPSTKFPGGYVRSIAVMWDHVKDSSVYPFTLPIIARLDSLPLSSGVTFFVGENGSGKSTLLEAIAQKAGMNVEGGSRNANYRTRIIDEPLGHAMLLVWGDRRPHDSFFLRAESLYNVITYHESVGGRLADLHEMSHGEGFMQVALRHFCDDGLYILDEPEAALSPTNLLAFMRRVHDLAQQGSQFIIATHSPILMTLPGATLYTLSDSGIEETDYRQTTHFALTKRILSDPESVLKQVLGDE